MGHIQQKISLLHDLCLICLVLCLIFLVLTAVLFIRFDIWNIFSIRTGLSVKKAVKRMEERNAGADEHRRYGSRDTSGSGMLWGEEHAVLETGVLPENRIWESATAEMGSGASESLETQALRAESERYDSRKAQEQVDQSYGKFLLESGEMLIHTEERI